MHAPKNVKYCFCRGIATTLLSTKKRVLLVFFIVFGPKFFSFSPLLHSFSFELSHTTSFSFFVLSFILGIPFPVSILKSLFTEKKYLWKRKILEMNTSRFFWPLLEVIGATWRGLRVIWEWRQARFILRKLSRGFSIQPGSSARPREISH